MLGIIETFLGRFNFDEVFCRAELRLLHDLKFAQVSNIPENLKLIFETSLTSHGFNFDGCKR